MKELLFYGKCRPQGCDAWPVARDHGRCSWATPSTPGATVAAGTGYASHAYISELESGKKVPTAALVLKVARRFDVSTDVLMKDELKLPSS